jgi:hypothetical protein
LAGMTALRSRRWNRAISADCSRYCGGVCGQKRVSASRN